MKKLFAIILSSLLAVSSISALEFKYGGKMDIGSSKIVGKDITNNLRPVLTFAMGGELDFGITDYFSIVPELNFRVLNGYKYIDPVGDKLEWNWMTIEIPLIFQYKLALGPGKLVFEAGPSFDIVIGQVSETITISGKATRYVGSNEDAGITKNVIAGLAGVGYQFAFDKSALTLGGRCKYDFTNNNALNTNQMHRLAFLFNMGFVTGF